MTHFQIVQVVLSIITLGLAPLGAFIVRQWSLLREMQIKVSNIETRAAETGDRFSSEAKRTEAQIMGKLEMMSLSIERLTAEVHNLAQRLSVVETKVDIITDMSK